MKKFDLVRFVGKPDEEHMIVGKPGAAPKTHRVYKYDVKRKGYFYFKDLRDEQVRIVGALLQNPPPLIDG